MMVMIMMMMMVAPVFWKVRVCASLISSLEMSGMDILEARNLHYHYQNESL